MVERTSLLVLLAKMKDANTASALACFSAKLNSIVARGLRQSFTYDQGKETPRNQELTAATGVNMYFRDPYSPGNAVFAKTPTGLRQYLPKGTDLSVYSQDELDAIADRLNSRPRATHAFHSPFEFFAATLALVSQSPSSKH